MHTVRTYGGHFAAFLRGKRCSFAAHGTERWWGCLRRCGQEMLCSTEIRKAIGKAIAFLIASRW